MLEITSNGSSECAAQRLMLLGEQEDSSEILSAIDAAAKAVASTTVEGEVGVKVLAAVAEAIRDLKIEVQVQVFAEQERDAVAAREAVDEIVDKLSESSRMLVLARLGGHTNLARNRAFIDAVNEYEARMDAEVAKTF